MRTDKYMMAKAWMKQDQAPQAEALETWNTLEAEFNEERKAMLMASAESDKIKEEMNKKFGPGTVKYGSELPPIQNPFEDFEKRNPAAYGGQMVKPSVDGSRPGYAGDATIKAREYLEKLPKNSDIVVLDIAKDLEIDRGVVDNVLKEKKFKKMKFKKLRKAGFLTNEKFAEEYINYQNSDAFKTGQDIEFAKYLNDKGFKAETKSGLFTNQSVNVRRQRLNIKSVSPSAIRLSDKDVLKEAKRFKINIKNLNPEEIRSKVLDKRQQENLVKKRMEDPELDERLKKEAIERSKKRRNLLLSTEEGRALLKEQQRKEKAARYLKEGLDPPANTADEMLWKDIVKTSKGDGRFTIKSGYTKSMNKNDYYSNKIKIKDSVTGKTFNFKTFKNFISKNAASFDVKNFQEVIKPYKQKEYINNKGLRNTLNEILIPGWSGGDPRTAYTVQHDFGRMNNPLKVSLAFYDDNLKEYKIRTDFEKAWEKSKTSKTPLADKKTAFNTFKTDIEKLNVKSSPSMITRDRSFGKELDLKSILQNAKKEGAVFKRGTLKEADEFNKNLIKLIGCPNALAGGGRAEFSNGKDCFDKGIKLVNSGMKNASPASLRNLAKLGPMLLKAGSATLKGLIIPEAVIVGLESAARVTMGDTPSEAILRATDYLTPDSFFGDFMQKADLMKIERTLGKDVKNIAAQSFDRTNQSDEINKLEEKLKNLEAMTESSDFGYVGDLTDQINMTKNQIKEKKDKLKNTAQIGQESRDFYTQQALDNAYDASMAKSKSAEKRLVESTSQNPILAEEQAMQDIRSQEQLNKNISARLPLTGSKNETAFLKLSQLPSGPRMPSEIDMLAANVNKKFKDMGSDRRVTSQDLKFNQDRKNFFKNASIEELVNMGLPLEAILGFNIAQPVERTGPGYKTNYKPLNRFGSQKRPVLYPNNRGTLAEGGITGLRSKYEYKK